MRIEHCFACGKQIKLDDECEPACADTRDGQIVYVGPECWRKIQKADTLGYQPSKGGPRLWAFYPEIK